MSDRDILGRTRFLSDHSDGTKVLEVAPGQEVCDFCLTPEPTWEYPCGPMSFPSMHPDDVNASDDEWAACDTCHELIEGGYMMRLAQHMVRTQAGIAKTDLANEGRATAIAIMMIEKFLAARQGEARPFQP